MAEPTMKKGLVLAGGGAKGSYQVGVWQALCELGWYPDIITGTSIGSLNGAMFAIDAAQTARDMWLTMGRSNVLAIPDDPTISELKKLLRDAVREGGLDVSPLEETIDQVLDEELVRNAKIRFGLVTVEVSNGVHRRQLSIDEIPEGKLKDYLLASAACFPAIRPRTIDGKLFLDGGFQDNMPFELAAKMGATELICVNIDGIGLTRPNFSKLPMRIIESHWDLGELFCFDASKTKQNIALGYYDTLRSFEKVRGTAYAIRQPDDETSVAVFRVKYDNMLLTAVKANPTLALTELTALGLFKAIDKPLAPLELAAQEAGVPPTDLYTIESLEEAFLAAYDPTKAEKFLKLFDGTSPKTAALAAVQPSDCIAAIVYYALVPDALATAAMSNADSFQSTIEWRFAPQDSNNLLPLTPCDTEPASEPANDQASDWRFQPKRTSDLLPPLETSAKKPEAPERKHTWRFQQPSTGADSLRAAPSSNIVAPSLTASTDNNSATTEDIKNETI